MDSYELGRLAAAIFLALLGVYLLWTGFQRGKRGESGTGFQVAGILVVVGVVVMLARGG